MHRRVSWLTRLPLGQATQQLRDPRFGLNTVPATKAWVNLPRNGGCPHKSDLAWVAFVPPLP